MLLPPASATLEGPLSWVPGLLTPRSTVAWGRPVSEDAGAGSYWLFDIP